MAKTFGKEDCIHVGAAGGCKIKKGCGPSSVYCRPIWMDTKCYSLEKPGTSEEFINAIYAHGETLVTRDPKTGKCWQLRPGDYMGEIPMEELIFVKRATLSD